MPSKLHVTSSSAMGFAGAFFGAMGSNPAIQYVAPNGNDAASGADWTNAKQTILAAYDALPPHGTSSEGGVIYIAADSFVGGEVAGQGIWIVGPSDPSYSSPLPGWRKLKFVRFVGVGQYSGESLGLGNPVRILGGQPPNIGNNGWGSLTSSKPAIWLAGAGGLWFESLDFSPLATAIRLGVSADQTSRNINTAIVMFKNIAAGVFNNGGGPVVDVGYAFWIIWDNCNLLGGYNDSGGTPRALTDDAHAVMLLKPDPGGNAPGLFTIRNNRWAAGGLKYTRGNGSSAGSLCVDDLLVEGSFTTPLPPAVWITDLDSNWTNVTLRGVSHADAGPGSMPVVQIDGAASAADAVMCFGIGGTVQGPCTNLGQNPAFSATQVVSPLRGGQVGVVGRRVTGQHDSTRRGFSPTAVRFTNLAQQDVTMWSGLTGNAVVTTGQTAPDGTTNAALVTSTSGIMNKQPYHANRTYAVGDIIVTGCWVRTTTPVYGNTPYIALSITGSGFSYATLDGGTADGVARYPFVGDGEWAWVAQAMKIITIGTNPVQTILALQVWSASPGIFYAPIFLHILTGTISDNEAAELVTHLQSWSNAATVGHLSPLKGEVINAIGGLATITKAGAPVDADYATPVDGLIVTDTTNNKIWTRIGGVWKGVVVS